ncbi:MAG: 16S rRNA (uracil(1498)-N(3))-methyltransferase, partial [Acidobacteriota bacterium]|nr:16S rRNA (uracil(1498)-N(3))-methyltransferase [Acidobacteriota bacterium]
KEFMSRRRFFVPEIRRGLAELSGPVAERLVRVLRAEVGQIYEISDNRDVYLAEITTARKSQIVFQVTGKLPSPAASVHLTLLPALIKFDRFEWMIEKATELGVDVIRPVEAIRTEHGLAQASQKRSARWEKIGTEASQQSRRARLPVIEPTVRLEMGLQIDANVRLFLDEDPQTPPIFRQLPENRDESDRVALLLGPEGGWTPEERKQVLAAEWVPCSLGTTILRAETAAISGLAIVKAAWELSRNARAGRPPAEV